MVSYLYASPSGIPGDVTRVDESNIEPVTLISPFPANYGLPMKYVSQSGGPEGVTPMVAADTASLFAGILTRQAPSISGSNTNEDFYTNEPNPDQIQGLCVRGYVSVFVNAGSPVRGQVVGLVVTASAGHPAGQLEVATTGNNVPLTGTLVGNVTWAADGVDSNGFGEVRIAQ
jgi:hypothetical protein